jgi:predicted protein tyrosine phosphatase
LGGVDVTADHGERLKAAFGLLRMPDMHRLAIPAEEFLIRAVEDALWRGQRLPDIGETAFIFGDFVEQRDVAKGSSGVRLEIAEVAGASDPDAAVFVHCHGSGGVGRSEDLAPGDAVILANHAAGGADEDDAAAILEDGPDLAVSAELVACVGLKDGDADFDGGFGGGFGG